MTERAAIDRLIVNSPWEEPARHWRYDRERRTFALARGRRPAGYLVASADSRAFDDPGRFVEIPLVNAIRPRVRAWREAGWPGATGITRRLLEHWSDPEEFDGRRFFFCQLEAAWTLIWLAEAPAAERTGIAVPSDGGGVPRLCAKMATGAGKTVVMAMILAWQILNKTAYPKDPRFSRDALVIAPGVTVRDRLAVLAPRSPDNYYEAFRIVPPALRDRLRRGRVLVRNRHALHWETDEKIAARRGVDKRGARSDEAWARAALDELADSRNLLVVNDEAHHAWRVPAGAQVRGVAKDEIERATRWVGALDRIARARGILACYDFSATPFAPSGRKSAEESLFGWIVSDFGLNDAIEAGLVKTPRVVVRDDAVPDARTWKSRLYHIYADSEAREDLNRKAEPGEPLPDLVANAYHLLGADWRETAKAWRAAGHPAPPAMITVANRTETAARIKHAFDTGAVRVPELCDPKRTLHIDSKALEAAEAGAGGGGAKGGEARRRAGELLRRQVDTVGRPGAPGADIQNVISVGMLSEGWDAKTVTHVMGLRAFASQLLCEQVVGRGLRRTSYDADPETGFFAPEYVNVFGVPFAFLPHEGGGDEPPPPPKPKTAIEPDPARAEFEISWPNAVRIDRSWRPRLALDWEALAPLEIDAAAAASIAELAPVVDGKPDLAQVARVDLEKLAREFRAQRLAFEAARDLHAVMASSWRGGGAELIAQLVRLAERFAASGKLRVVPDAFARDPAARRVAIALNMTRVVQHLGDAVRCENAERLEPVFDSDRPIRSTGDMVTWWTGRPCGPAARSHINFCVHDSAWEASEAFALDHAPEVAAWAKNDRLGFEIPYVHRGAARKYRPDFLIRLRSGAMLVLETKGREGAADRTKRRFLDEWAAAVTAHGGFGRWSADVSRAPGDVRDILARHARGRGALPAARAAIAI